MPLRYVTLDKLFPDQSRTTRHRWLKKGLIPKPDLVIGNRKFWIERRGGQPRSAAGAGRNISRA
jgi:hypothetical protein